MTLKTIITLLSLKLYIYKNVYNKVIKDKIPKIFQLYVHINTKTLF